MLLCIAQAWATETSIKPDSAATPGQHIAVVRRTHCVIHPLFFHYDDDVVDMDYMGNDSVMRSFRYVVDSVGLSHIDSIRVIVQSSPEGSAAHNFDLSRRRAINTERYLSDRYPDIMPVTQVVADGESWQALRRYIVNDTVLSSSDINRLVNIIDHTSDLWLRKQKLQATGDIYKYLYSTYYPSLRNSIIATVYSTDVYTATPTRQGVADTIYMRDTVYVRQTVVVDSIINIIGGIPAKTDTVVAVADTVLRDPVFALKTNMLFDLVTALNGELEVPVGSRSSVLAEVVWPWWLQKSHNRWCFEMGSGSLEYRYWFRSWRRHCTWRQWEMSRRQPLRGAFVGFYGGGGYYDYQWKRHNGYQGEFYSAGLTLGYSRYVSRYVRLEFSLGGGYVQNKYRTYHIDDNTSVQPDRDQHLYRDGRFRNSWFGPTKAKISLSVLLHRKCRQKGVGL